MDEDIKLPPYPEGLCLREDIEDYAREAVRLNAQDASQSAQPLTEKEIDEMLDAPGNFAYVLADKRGRAHLFARAIEQAATAPLLARIAELETELEKTKAIFAASCNHAAVMELERDAKRYHLLRRKVCIVGDSFHFINIKPTYIAPDAAIELDSAIDAALKE